MATSCMSLQLRLRAASAARPQPLLSLNRMPSSSAAVSCFPPMLPMRPTPAADLKKVQEIFLTERDAPPISWNMPPIAGALYWCRGLKERLVEPMAKIRQLNKDIMSREEAKEVLKVSRAAVPFLP